MSDKRDDDGGRIGVREVGGEQERPKVVIIPPVRLKVNLGKKSKSTTVAFGVMIVLVVCAIVSIAVIFMTALPDKKSLPSSGQTLAERQKVEAEKGRIEMEASAIKNERAKSKSAVEVGSDSLVIPNVQIKVQSRAGENKLDLEIMMPNEEKLFYVCEPTR